MPSHRLPAGLALIGFLERLAMVLGYSASIEHPVDGSEPTGQAIDVAWFRAENERFPLMVFEVESRPTRAMGANVAKVFAKETSRYEKPLFFFHLVMEGGQRSATVEDLQHQYGTQNYRLYRLAVDDPCALLEDVITQHRRLVETLDLPSFVDVVSDAGWTQCQDRILQHVEASGFAAAYRVTYAQLALVDSRFVGHLERVLRRSWADSAIRVDVSDWPSYLGWGWSGLLEMALLAHLDQSESKKWISELIKWHENTNLGLTRTEAALGLSQELDDFVVGVVGHLWAAVALMVKQLAGREYILRCLLHNLQILEKTANEVGSFPTAVWTAHVAAASGDVKTFEQARTHVNDRGGVAEEFLYEPPRALTVTIGEEDWIYEFQLDPVQIPTLEIFVQNVLTRTSTLGPADPLHEGLHLLLDNEYLREPSGPLLRALYTA